MRTKTFDCVEMKRRGAAALRRKLDSLDRGGELAFWRRVHQELLMKGTRGREE